MKTRMIETGRQNKAKESAIEETAALRAENVGARKTSEISQETLT